MDVVVSKITVTNADYAFNQTVKGRGWAATRTVSEESPICTDYAMREFDCLHEAKKDTMALCESLVRLGYDVMRAQLYTQVVDQIYPVVKGSLDEE